VLLYLIKMSIKCTMWNQVLRQPFYYVYSLWSQPVLGYKLCQTRKVIAKLKCAMADCSYMIKSRTYQCTSIKASSQQRCNFTTHQQSDYRTKNFVINGQYFSAWTAEITSKVTQGRVQRQFKYSLRLVMCCTLIVPCSINTWFAHVAYSFSLQ